MSGYKTVARGQSDGSKGPLCVADKGWGDEHEVERGGWTDLLC